ncbi:OmpA family protein [Porphyromonas sp.]|uniref:OmpA family protein n=1 Tax=Porphyromonas sp. TaxID=1924944 RepID=UPI0026DB302D|nr:OmpA family protein [Porphyromonas sp.]MDO4770967.1 OmpA family protein [Porphyromonas sp.]
MIKKFILIQLFLWTFLGIAAQDANMILNQVHDRKSREIGLGGNLLNISRMTLSNYNSSEKGDAYTLRLHNVMFGGNLYVAHELTPWLYADLQATLGRVTAIVADRKEAERFFGLGGLGLQFRLTPLFKKKYVEPYFRIGANYMYKEFGLAKQGSLPNFRNDELRWGHSDAFNKEANMERHLFLPSVGFGVNSWFNDRVGFGIQGDYMTSLGAKRLSFPQVIARVMIRFGSTKEAAPRIVYRERVVRETVPVEKEIIKYVEKDCDPLYKLFSNITFEFDRYEITPESEPLLDEIAKILKGMPESRFLITGHTDARGSVAYNERLSARRAEAIVQALEGRGVFKDMLKSRGAGKRIAAIPASDTHEVREGDRKVTIELIVRMPYWNKLPKRGY